MAQTARFADAGEREEEELHAALMAAATDLGVPLEPRGLQVSRDRAGAVRIVATWEEPVVVGALGLAEWVDTLHFAYEMPEPEP